MTDRPYFDSYGWKWIVKWTGLMTFVAPSLQWLIIWLVWDPPHGLHLQQLIDAEIATATRIGCDEYAIRVANELIERLFHWAEKPQAGPADMFEKLLWDIFQAIHSLTHVAMLGTQLFGLRLVVYLSYAPLMALGVAVGIAEGWAARYIRRDSAGHESSYRFHRGKHWLAVAPVVFYGVYLGSPVPLNPELLAAPCAAAMGVFSAMGMKWFKKYV